MKISIIVPIYNVERYLRECLDSLLHQDLPSSDYEIILVNDGSKDRSGEIARDYADRHEHISCYEQPNQGQAVARNLGLDKAQGEYILFVDSDDYIEQNVLGQMYREAKENENDILITGSINLDKHGEETKITDFYDFNKNYTGAQALLNGLNMAGVCSRLYRREFLNQNHLRFRAGIKHEDVYFNVEAYPLAGSIRSLDIYTYFYRWNEGSTDRSFDAVNVMKALMSDLEIVKLEADQSRKYATSNPALSQYFRRQSNSLLVSNLLSFYTANRTLPASDRKRYMAQAKAYGLLPIQGKTNSWKTQLLAWVFNLLLHPLSICC